MHLLVYFELLYFFPLAPYLEDLCVLSGRIFCVKAV